MSQRLHQCPRPGVRLGGSQRKLCGEREQTGWGGFRRKLGHAGVGLGGAGSGALGEQLTPTLCLGGIHRAQPSARQPRPWPRRSAGRTSVAGSIKGPRTAKMPLKNKEGSAPSRAPRSTENLHPVTLFTQRWTHGTEQRAQRHTHTLWELVQFKAGIKW